MTKTFDVFFILFISFELFSCKTAEFGSAVVNLNGMVYDFENKPLVNYTIVLGKKNPVITDITGRFFIPKVKAGRYTITGNAAGYESYENEIIISDKKQIVYLRIPSSQQLLDLADAALTKNQITEAEGFVQRAYNIGVITNDLLYFMAIISFRKGIYSDAIYYLEGIIQRGTTDEYVYRFLDELNKRSVYEK